MIKLVNYLKFSSIFEYYLEAPNWPWVAVLSNLVLLFRLLLQRFGFSDYETVIEYQLLIVQHFESFDFPNCKFISAD